MNGQSKHCIWKIGEDNGRAMDVAWSPRFDYYESIELSTLLYGVETWPITVANERRLEAADHGWLRRILHVSWMDRMSNTVVGEKTGQEELGCIIRRGRHTWLGHVDRNVRQ